MEKALFGAGCFWGVEETFCKTPGVINTLVGYSGGDTINPSYESVCQGNTNHTEVVLVEFDNSKISYEDLLMVFWKCHDPTTLNRQGPDIGTQYRSAIYYYNEDQKNKSIHSKNEHAKSAGFLTGWVILLLFWSTIVFFIYLRKPPKSKLTKSFVIKSYLFFLALLFIILFFR